MKNLYSKFVKAGYEPEFPFDISEETMKNQINEVFSFDLSHISFPVSSTKNDLQYPYLSKESFDLFRFYPDFFPLNLDGPKHSTRFEKKSMGLQHPVELTCLLMKDICFK